MAVSINKQKELMKKLKITESQKAMLEAKASAKLKEEIKYSQSPSAKVTKAFKTAGANRLDGVKVEGIEVSEDITMTELAPKVLDFLKLLYTNPTKAELDPFWETVDVSWDELIQLLTELQLIKSVPKGYRLQKLDRVGGPTAVVRIVTKLVGKLINDKKKPVDEIETKDINADYFKKQIGEPKKTGKTRAELLAVIAKKKAEEAKRREAENNRPIGELEEDNYPLGAANDPRAPYNEPETPEGKQPSEKPFELKLWINEFAFFTKDGKLYLYNVESANEAAYSDYASRDEYGEKDEDGIVNIDYGDWEMKPYIIDAYVNDNYRELSFGKGVEAYYDGIDFIEVDKALVDELLPISEFMKPNDAKPFVDLLQSFNIDETTTAAGSSGAFVGSLSSGAKFDSNVEDEMSTMSEIENDGENVKADIISGVTPFIKHAPKSSMLFWLSHESKLKGIVDKIQTLGDDEWSLIIEFIVKALQSAESYLKTKDKSFIQKFEFNIDSLGIFTKHLSTQIGEATTSISVGGDSGTFTYDAPVGDGGDFWAAGNKLNKKKTPTNEDAKTDTQWPNGSFVEFDDCTKLNNNKTAQNGGCSTGAVDNVVKTKTSKNSVISDSSIYETVAKETGRSVEEVKSILSSKNNESK